LFQPSIQIGPAHHFGPVHSDGLATSTPLGPRPPGRAHPPLHPHLLPRVGCRRHLTPEHRRVTTPGRLPIYPFSSPKQTPPHHFPYRSPIIAPPLHGRNRRHQWCPSKHSTGHRRPASLSPPPPCTYKRAAQLRLTSPDQTPPSLPRLLHWSMPPPQTFGHRHRSSLPGRLIPSRPPVSGRSSSPVPSPCPLPLGLHP
jgi:hypothetical protein